MPVPVAVYDANVLYPAPLRDFLVRLAMTGAVRARWTEEIHEEWIRNLLQRRRDLEAAQLERTRRLMNAAVPDCLVTGYVSLIPQLDLPDPDDRHVLAAAIRARAHVIVTFNIKDFPRRVLHPFSLRALRPDAFVVELLDAAPELVFVAARAHRSALQRPRLSREEYLDSLRRVRLTRTAERLDRECSDL